MTDRVCPHCGGRYVDERHVELCEASPFSGVDECPMCGEPYDSYTGHLQRCDGGAD
jgi:hypothetical protein